MTADFLIVGQGLAGTCIARRLQERGVSFRVMDDGLKTSSSLVAAGMWNPIVFKRLNKSWKAEEFLPALESFYGDMQSLLGEQIMHSIPIDRFFPDLDAAKLWDEKSDLPGFSPYLDQSPEGSIPPEVEAPFGTGRVNGGGYVDLETMLFSYRRLLEKEELIIEEAFDAQNLELHEDGLSYGHYSFGKVIFCMGYRNLENPWFKELPLRTTKGEVLTIHSEDLPYESVMNVGRFLLPVGDGKFRLGATYDWHTTDSELTDEARDLLLKKAEKLLYAPYEVIDQKAGIRPTVKDRRPLVGTHPDHPQLSIFNGLGTKGVMIAPWLSSHFMAHLFDGQDLDPEVNISRFLP